MMVAPPEVDGEGCLEMVLTAIMVLVRTFVLGQVVYRLHHVYQALQQDTSTRMETDKAYSWGERWEERR